MPFVAAGDTTRLHHLDWGDGPAIVFSHCWALGADQIAPLELTGRRTADAIPGSVFSVYPGGSHGPFITHRALIPNAAYGAELRDGSGICTMPRRPALTHS
jgi:hypothetical protein